MEMNTFFKSMVLASALVSSATVGAEESEVEQAKAAGFHPITLGRRILRTETAGMTVMSWLMYRLEG